MTNEEFQHAMDYERETIARLQKGIGVAEFVVAHLPNEFLDEIRSVAVYSVSTDIYLKQSCPRETAQLIAARLTKLLGKGTKHKGGASLYVLYDYEGTSVYLQNYIPPTCRVVKQTRVIPARPESVEEYESIECTIDEDVDE